MSKAAFHFHETVKFSPQPYFLFVPTSAGYKTAGCVTAKIRPFAVAAVNSNPTNTSFSTSAQWGLHNDVEKETRKT